jgi:hypothetical protein
MPSNTEELEAVTKLLGYQLRTAAQQKSASVRSRQRPQRQAESEPAPLVETTKAEGKPRKRVDSVLTQVEDGKGKVPDWLFSAPQLEERQARVVSNPVAFEALFASRSVRAILSGALATPSEDGPMDIVKAIDLICQGEAIRRTPRHSIATMTRGVQLLLDSSPLMQPFFSDQNNLRDEIVRVVGRDRTEVQCFSGIPSRGIGTGPVDEWLDYRPPTQGTTVVVVTDFAIGKSREFFASPDEKEWVQFVNMLARLRCPVLAMVPYPPSRWPRVLSKCCSILQWDRATTASIVKRTLPDGLKSSRS